MPGPLDGPDIKDGQAVGRVATDYCLTSLAAIKKFLSDTIGYGLNIPDNATGIYGRHVFRNGNLVSELSAPVKYGDVAVNRVERDKYGYIRVSGPATSRHGEEGLFEAVLLEHLESGQVRWRAVRARTDQARADRVRVDKAGEGTP